MISDSPTLPSFLFGAGVVMIHALLVDSSISRYIISSPATLQIVSGSHTPKYLSPI